jgi:Ca2+-binding EF-hand superfamily protein
MFDVDGDGDIDPTEMQKCFKFFGQNPTMEEVIEMIKEVDDDGSMQIEEEEFLELMAKGTVGIDPEL